MDEEQARAAMIKATRREILAVLLIMYDIGPFAFESICGSLLHLELSDETYVRRDLLYLCEKGYVTWTNPGKFTPWNSRMYKLTAAGNEIANKIERDSALEP